MKFIVYAANGQILRSGECPEEMLLLQAGVDRVAQELPDNISDPENYYVDMGGLIKKLEQPSPHYIFDYTLKQWVDPRTLADLKATKTAEINAARLRANRGTFTFMGKQISCDELSRSDIDGVNGIVSLTGAMPPDWVGFWKTAGNEYITIPDVATWTGLYGAMVAQGQANFTHSQALKAQLEAATTAAEVEAIAVTW